MRSQTANKALGACLPFQCHIAFSCEQEAAGEAPHPGTSAAEAVYEQAVIVLPSATMYKLWCIFLQQQMEAAGGHNDTTGRLSGVARQWAKHLHAVVERARTAGASQAQGISSFNHICSELSDSGLMRPVGLLSEMPVF